MPLRTARLLGVPIDDQGLQVIPPSGLPVPAVGPKGGPHAIDLMVRLGGDQEVRIHIAAVESGRAREQITLGKVAGDGGAHATIRRGGGRGEHWRDEIRLVRITGLGEVDLRTDPLRVPFTTVARREIVGGGEAPCRRRWLVAGAPAERFPPRDGTAVIVVPPNLPQRLQGRELPHTEGGIRGPHPFQELIAIGPDRAGARLTCAGVLRQTGLVGPEAIASIPRQRHVLLAPGGSHSAARVEHLMQGFQETCQPVARADRRQAMRGSGPVRAPRLDPAAGFAGGQEGTRGTVGPPHGRVSVAENRAPA
jgi:hypothetical protein